MLPTIFTLGTGFWLLVGALIGVAATLAFGGLWRHAQLVSGNKRGAALGALGVIAVAIVAVTLYGSLGRPDLAIDSAPMPHAMNTANNTATATATPTSMEGVTSQLAARLARDGGSDSDWQLLAQSYDFMGRSEDAAQARKHFAAAPAASEMQADVNSTAASPNAMPTTSSESSSNANNKLAALTEQTKARPRDANAWLALAEAQRLQRNYSEAHAAFDSVIKLKGMSADSWANYADVIASQAQGKLSGAPAQAIDKALALNPNHTKALWLKASLAHEEQRYSESLGLWKRLRAVIGDNESDARIIDANIAEAEQLSGQPAAAKNIAKNIAKNTGAPTAAAIAGTIEIDPKLLARAVPGTTLFVYAKAIDAPGPPLAVFRTSVGKWPVNFKLDDSMAMLPSRNLSSAATVVVSARISFSGQAIAASGDLETAGTRVNVSGSKPIRLRIDKEVG